MTRNSAGALEPAPQAMERQIRQNRTMHDEDYSRMRFGHLSKLDTLFKLDEDSRHSDEVFVPLVLPPVPDHRRVIYDIYEYKPLLDSSNMTMVSTCRIIL